MAETEKKLRRRVYMRNMMKIYRDEFKKEMAYLREKEQQLEVQVQHLLQTRCLGGDDDSSGALPWREVSQALKEEHDEAKAKREKLLTQVMTHRRVVDNMERWVAAQMTIPVSPTTPTSTWRNTTLLGDPTSRQLGKQWIMEQMFHNTDRVFQMYQFPAMDRAHDLYGLEAVPTPNGGFQYIHRRQFDLGHPLDMLLQLYKDTVYRFMTPDAVYHNNVAAEESNDTTLRTLHNSNGEVMHLLTRAFSSGQRSVFVGQEILDDDLLPITKPKQRSRMIWFDIVPLSPTKCRLRCLYIYSNFFDNKGESLPFEEEAKGWNFDPSLHPPESLEDRFRTHVRAVAIQRFRVSRTRAEEETTARGIPTYKD
ncbi:hypothetical protein AeNC1_003358 [Aphanomyces euteiches]|nr:hypothetical protein AeNC1_003358 [Aphanomyces euteiches]